MNKRLPIYFILLFIFLHFSLAYASEIDSTLSDSINIRQLYRQSVIGFTEESLKQAFNDSTNKQTGKATATFDRLEVTNRFIDNLTPSDLNELPIGLKRTISNITYTIAISNAIFYSTYAELTVFAKVKIAQRETPLFFGISGLKFSYEGGIVGEARLVLLGDVPFLINGGNAAVVLKGGFNMNGQAPADVTYLTMDCNGFRQLGVNAEVIFPRSLLIPCNAKGDAIVDESKQVRGAFQTVVSDWNDILVTISLPKFQINKLKDVVFTISEATFDLSDVRNSSNIVFPAGYESKYIHYPNPFMWRGVYIKTLEVALPKAFATRGSTERAVFGANNLIIDNNGLTGNLYGKNVLSFSKGSASGWKFSVNELRINVEANNLKAASFKGNISLPTADRDSLKYEALITADNKYMLTVSPQHSLDFDIWQAKVTLDSNSYVKLLLDDGQFRPEANLSGKMTIKAKNNPNSSKSFADFEAVTFRGLHLRTQNPYLTVSYFGYNGEIKMANFPVSADSIALTSTGTQAALSFGLKLTLMDGKFKAETRLTIAAKFRQEEGLQSWGFESVKLNEIAIKGAKLGGLTLDGRIAFLENDPIYGDGFGGSIKAKFDALKGMEIQVRARFGKTTFRYWFVDAKVEWGGNGISVGGPLNVHGFAGGAYYRMSKINPNASSFVGGQLPAYKPDSIMGLGVKAAMLFNVGSRSKADGMVEFEMAFNSSGGLNYIGFFGSAKFMGKLPIAGNLADKAGELIGKIDKAVSDKLEGLSKELKLDQLNLIQNRKINEPQKAAQGVPTDVDMSTGISAYVGMHYDFANQTFHANFDIFVNTAQGMLQGIGNRYRAGWAVMHFQPGEWYVYMGTPTDPIGVQFVLGSFKLRTESYFMLGTKIPGSPPPPQEVADILGLELSQLDYMRDLNALGEGRGIAYGSRLSVQTGDITFLILYANFSAGIGFDLMLKEYPDAHCEGSSSPIGIQGWYANAQAYVYLQGELGVKVDLWFIKAKIPIISGGVAALMQAKIPNPSWFRGYLGVRFSVLGGLVQGRANFKVQVGNECKIVNGGQETPLGIRVIADITPKDTVKVDVFTAPQVAFNFPMEKDIPISDENGNHIFRIKLEKFEISSGANPLSASLEWNAGKDIATLYSTEVLLSNASVKAYVKVSFVELKAGSWQTVYINGKKAEEERTLRFTTGTAPESIPLTNVLYSYPVVNQLNLYREESRKGYVQLKRGQTYLFRVPGYSQGLVLKNENNLLPLPLVYDSAQRVIQYTLPSLLPNRNYSFNLISKSTAVTSGQDGIASKTQQAVSATGDTLKTTLSSRQAANVINTGNEKVLLGYAFHTSVHATFAAKVNSISNAGPLVRILSSDVIELEQKVNQYEPFDLPEIMGTSFTQAKPLIQPVALLRDSYYQQDIFPLNYQNYPPGGVYISNRDTLEFGLHPAKALPVPLSYQINLEQENYSSQFVNQVMPFSYDLARIYKADFSDLQSQVVNRYLGTGQANQFRWLIEGRFPFIREGLYEVQYNYILPSGEKGSPAIVNYANPIK